MTNQQTTEGRTRRTQKERRAVTEQRLIEATLRLISRSGSRSMTLAEVGREAGYSRGIVNHQFGSRQELLSKAATYAQVVLGDVDQDSQGLDWLLGMVRVYLTDAADQEDARRAFLIMWVEAVADEPSLRPIYVERDVWFRQLLAGSLQHGIAEGTIRADVDPGAMAVVVLGQLRGVKLQQMLTPDAAPAQLVRDEAVEMIRRALST